MLFKHFANNAAILLLLSHVATSFISQHSNHRNMCGHDAAKTKMHGLEPSTNRFNWRLHGTREDEIRRKVSALDCDFIVMLRCC